jgi:GNAT superfamily N-acetyltransferase
MISTRAATSRDAPDAVVVLRRSITELCVADHKNDEASLQAWLRNKTTEHFERWLADPDSHIIVAEQGGEIRGVGAVHKSGEIRLCYVLPGHQAAGIGRAMLSALEARARVWQLKRLQLQSTSGARAFYERGGYSATGPATCGVGITACYPYQRELA